MTSAFLFSFLLVRHLLLDLPGVIKFLPAVFINIGIFGICVLFFPIYKGIIRYSEINDIIRIIKFAALQFVLWLAVYSFDSRSIVTGFLPIPLLIINLFSVIFILVTFRLLIK
jgi:FlaA1/EpsC-like NDP-sugar epimerase